MKTEDYKKHIDDALAKYPDAVTRYKSGKTGLMGLFCGEVMKSTKGQADPKTLVELLTEALSSPSHSEETETTENTGKQPFEAFAALAEHIERMGSTGNTGTTIDWSGFLGELNAVVKELQIAQHEIGVLKSNLLTERKQRSEMQLEFKTDRAKLQSDNEAKEKRIQELERLLNESNSVMGTAKRRIVFLEGYSEGKHEPSDKYVRQINEAIKANDQALTPPIDTKP